MRCAFIGASCVIRCAILTTAVIFYLFLVLLVFVCSCLTTQHIVLNDARLIKYVHEKCTVNGVSLHDWPIGSIVGPTFKFLKII